MKIHCFGAARDIAGGSSLHLEDLEGITIGDLRQRLVTAYPGFGELVSFAIARNEEYARDEERITPGDELVIIPPVAGG
ncbi:molybdopterin synthase sulfur carrier subunit [Neolewinella xylanilytica]|uniref:Molybdopterin synthase sulfur carrier subunit n=1 Tax=Neolewinella xylanilytica TaxID=1514080 RepID=A0A2S6I4R4_9BACT|nr:MoaD/ThiS family protein [Neolewinella xylanilytica]PPK86132.1 molybdopterin synthase sulfur carrier subunit [Neolewinella xylanilytica]